MLWSFLFSEPSFSIIKNEPKPSFKNPSNIKVFDKFWYILSIFFTKKRLELISQCIEEIEN